MNSDSIATNSSKNILPMASSNAKDFAKKKRVNRAAKLKQCKLDARREQWLSLVKKTTSGKDESNGVSAVKALSNAGNVRGRAIGNLEIRPRGEEDNNCLHMHHYSDSESPSNSPMSHNGSIMGGTDSGTTFTGSSRNSSSSRSGGSCSGSMSEEYEEGDDECLDNWEIVADALAANEEKQKQHDQSFGTDIASKSKDVAHEGSPPDDAARVVPGAGVLKAKLENGISSARSPVQCRAWSPDDVFRPQSLPNLSKQYSFPMNSDRFFGCGGPVWGCKNVGLAPTSCPICYEDLDYTDSSFIPCSCGFKLCLFCHKRILEEDGRCPGCRKQYKNNSVKGEAMLDGGSLTFRLARSCSMVTRS